MDVFAEEGLKFFGIDKKVKGSSSTEIVKLSLTFMTTIWGLKVMPSVPVYGSNYYKDTLNMWTPKAEHKYFTPTVSVKAPLKIQFGIHEVEIIPFPGHSICTNIFS